jgi:hypothetical protein
VAVIEHGSDVTFLCGVRTASGVAKQRTSLRTESVGREGLAVLLRPC